MKTFTSSAILSYVSFGLFSIFRNLREFFGTCQVDSHMLFLFFLLSGIRTHRVSGHRHPHPECATPSPCSEALTKRQVVSHRIRPTSWFKESRGQDFWRWLDFWPTDWIKPRLPAEYCAHYGVKTRSQREWFAPFVCRCASGVSFQSRVTKRAAEKRKKKDRKRNT